MIQLGKRDKIALAIGTSSLLIFLFLQFFLFPLMEKREKLANGIEKHEKSVVVMREMQKRYGELSAKNVGIAGMLEERAAGFSLFSFLEKGAANSKVKGNIAYMKPSEDSGNELLEQSQVEMKLQAISLQQLVVFLQEVESIENLVALQRISIQENKKEKEALDVTLQVISVDEVVSGTQ